MLLKISHFKMLNDFGKGDICKKRNQVYKFNQVTEQHLRKDFTCSIVLIPCFYDCAARHGICILEI